MKQGHALRQQINNRLGDLEKQLNDIEAQLLAESGHKSQFSTTDIVNRFRGPQEPRKAPKSLTQAVTGIVDDMEAKKLLTPQGKVYEKNSIRAHRTAIGMLERWQKQHYPLNLDQLNDQKVREYHAWMTAENYSKNNIAQNLKCLRRWVNLLDERGLVDNKPKITTNWEDTSLWALYQSEIDGLQNCTMPHEYLENARKLMVIQCYTCVRVSDLGKLQAAVTGDKFAFRTKKGSTVVVIPILPAVQEIIATGWPRTISKQRYNDYMKKVCRIAGIDREVSETRTVGGVEKEFFGPIYEMIASHRLRGTGITMMIRMGIPDRIIMQISGHRTLTAFRRYVQFEKTEAADYVAAAFRRKTGHQGPFLEDRA